MEFLRTDIFDLLIYGILLICLFLGGMVLLYNSYNFYRKPTVFNFSFDLKSFKISGLIYLSSIFFLAIASFGPVFDFSGNLSAKSSNIIFVLDLSKSMDAMDVSISGKNESRLDAAKQMIKSFIKKNPSNSYSLIGFAESTILISPLTQDLDAISTYLNSSDTDLLAKSGTNIKSVFDFINGYNQNKSMLNYVFLSDGEDFNENEPKGLLNEDTLKNARIFTVGLGSEKGAFIPDGVNFIGDTMFKNFDGKRVVSKLNKAFLTSLSDIGKGKYVDGTSIESLDLFKQYFISTNAVKYDIERKASDAGIYFAMISFLLVSTAYFLNYKR